MSQNRYITLCGDPAGEKLRYTFHRAADIRAGILSTAFVTAVTLILPENYTGDFSTTIAFSITALNKVMGAIGSRATLASKARVHGIDPKTKCIDTQPDQDTPPPALNSLAAATLLYEYNKVGVASTAGYMMAAYFVSHFSAYKRFDAVLHDRARIIDLPPPAKITELEQQRNTAPLPTSLHPVPNVG